MPNPFEYQFEWDPIKAHQNARKHGVTFDRAATVFLDSQALSEFDEEHRQEEDRWITLGYLTLLIVCHTYQEETQTSGRIRIMSARKATKDESNQYGG